MNGILLKDLLRFSDDELANVKIKFNQHNGYDDPTKPQRKGRFFPMWNPIFVEMTNGRWMPALATLWPTTCLTAARCFAPRRSTTMWNLGCLVLKTSICRKSCIVAPKQKESGSASVYWGAALRNVRNPLIPERNSGIGRSMK